MNFTCTMPVPNVHLCCLFVPSVSVRLSVRCWALDGLMLLLSDSKQMDFVVLSLKGGKVRLSADLGKGPASILSSAAVNDGQWHTVSLSPDLQFQASRVRPRFHLYSTSPQVSAEVSRRSVSVAVDASHPASVSIKGNHLDLDRTLFLGGLPPGVKSRRISVRTSYWSPCDITDILHQSGIT